MRMPQRNGRDYTRRVSAPEAQSERPPALLSFDVEDWGQLMRRSLGDRSFTPSGADFERQLAAVLDLLDELGAGATFFLLGATAERYPAAMAELAARGHEVASHGYAHDRVSSQSEREFREDVQRSVEIIGELTGRRPAGYRAPLFSVTRDTPWAYEVLADLGFRYDSSQYDSPRIPGRLEGVPAAPYRLRLASGRELWELPVAVCRVLGRTVPVGGGSYWRLLPGRVLVGALRRSRRSTTHPVLYFHPYECDPELLRAALPPSPGARERLVALAWHVWFNPGRKRVVSRIRRVAQEFRLVSYEEAHGEIAERYGSRTRALSEDGVLV
jgi:polysaccharide deacetylase family protein (PEP-CTERM system associated)